MTSKKLIKHKIITQINQNFFEKNSIILIESDLLLSNILVNKIKLHKFSLLQIFSQLNILKYFKVGPCSLRIIPDKTLFFNNFFSPSFYPLLIKYKNIICLNKIYSIQKIFNIKNIITKINFLCFGIVLRLIRTIIKINNKIINS
tara:strand:- start:20492 stop:20926 length:435 start_codon:yes stop_codon:yes gene_type:complete